MKIKALTLAPVFALTFSAAAFAAAHLDTDGDGAYSMDELTVAYPDMTEETFAAIDADASGTVTEEELQAAVDAGTVAAVE